MKRKMTTGFYQPTESFKSIPEHFAVMYEDDRTLVAVLGAVDDNVENVKESIACAKLFAASNDLLEACELAEKELNKTNAGKYSEALGTVRAAIRKAKP